METTTTQDRTGAHFPVATSTIRTIRRIRVISGLRPRATRPANSAWQAKTLRENQTRPFARRLLGLERDRARFYDYDGAAGFAS